jgi:chemotaxis signal transduction protein
VVVHLDERARDAPPEVLSAQGDRFVSSIARAGDRLLMLIDFQKVVGEEGSHGQ